MNTASYFRKNLWTCCAHALLIFLPTALLSQTLTGDSTFRISFAGPDGNTAHDATHDGVAYNDLRDEYLVVWDADDRIPGSGATFNGKREVFGRVVAGDGATQGPTRLLATSGPFLDSSWDAENPEVVYNSVSNEYFVIWVATVASTGAQGKREIFGQRVDIDGNLVASPTRLTQTGIDGNLRRDSKEPSIAFNSADNEYFVVWQFEESDVGSRVENEIYAQRVSGANGQVLGGPIRVSTMGPNGVTSFDAIDPDVTYAQARNEYLVVWRGDDDRGALQEGEFEIFAQRLSANGEALGVDDHRISSMGPNGDPGFKASDAAAAYNPDLDEYLVTWTGLDDPAVGEEVYGQRLSPATDTLIGPPIRISSMGPEGDPTYVVDESLVLYNPDRSEYFVVWIGADDRVFLGPGENEVFGQRLSPTGEELGIDDARLSHLGPDGDSHYDAFSIGLERNTLRDEYFLVLSGDDNRGTQVDDEVEVFGQHVAPDTPACIDELTAICLANGRFEVRIDWRTAAGDTGQAWANRLSADTAWFWFFSASNVEVVVKVLDGRGINGRFWVFFGALSNVEYFVTVTDTETGERREYHNPLGSFASVGDTRAFPLPENVSAVPQAATEARHVSRKMHATPEKLACQSSPVELCLNNDRFRIQVEWTGHDGTVGVGRAEPLAADTGWFWFFGSSNTELMIKVLDGRGINGHFWVFFGALSDVAYTVTVTDTQSGQVRVYENEPGTLASVGDTEAFAAP